MDVKAAMLGMWKDTGVRRAAAKSHEYTQNDILSFYFENVERTFDLAWIPTNQDMVLLNDPRSRNSAIFPILLTVPR
jgi:hypothetical protein